MSEGSPFAAELYVGLQISRVQALPRMEKSDGHI